MTSECSIPMTNSAVIFAPLYRDTTVRRPWLTLQKRLRLARIATSAGLAQLPGNTHAAYG